MTKLDFLREGLKNLKTVGTLTRSSKFLCEKIVEKASLNGNKCIVELGAGDGVLTEHILKAMPQDCTLLAFEINESFVDILHQIDDERLVVISESAETVGKHIESNGFSQVDTVFSAIPFVVIPVDVSEQIVNSCKEYLRADGDYLQIHYSLLEKKLYEKIFGEVDVQWVPLNLPPAFILHCRK